MNLKNVTTKEAKEDMNGRTCLDCKKGKYYVATLNDDIQGICTCKKCGKQVPLNLKAYLADTSFRNSKKGKAAATKKEKKVAELNERIDYLKEELYNAEQELRNLK